jgi:hypothetical protein
MRVRHIIAAMVAVASAFAAFPATGSALIHSPANGATYQVTANIYFDWTWQPDEYAASHHVRSSGVNDKHVRDVHI